jgi:YD repeat-containing protein
MNVNRSNAGSMQEQYSAARQQSNTLSYQAPPTYSYGTQPITQGAQTPTSPAPQQSNTPVYQTPPTYSYGTQQNTQRAPAQVSYAPQQQGTQGGQAPASPAPQNSTDNTRLSNPTYKPAYWGTTVDHKETVPRGGGGKTETYVDNHGNSVNFTYDKKGKLATERDIQKGAVGASGNQTTYDFDAKGNRSEKLALHLYSTGDEGLEKGDNRLADPTNKPDYWDTTLEHEETADPTTGKRDSETYLDSHGDTVTIKFNKDGKPETETDYQKGEIGASGSYTNFTFDGNGTRSPAHPGPVVYSAPKSGNT